MTIEDYVEASKPSALFIWRERASAGEGLDLGGLVADNVGYLEVNGNLFFVEAYDG